MFNTSNDSSSYDYLSEYPSKFFDRDAILEERIKAERLFDKLKVENPLIAKTEQLFRKLDIEEDFFNFSIKKDESISLEVSDKYKSLDQHKTVEQVEKRVGAFLRSLCPWKKGPFTIMDNYIDAEWRSDIKWNRIKDKLGIIEGKKIADLGCNNGYFMYRLAEFNPKLLLGVETYPRYRYVFDLISPYVKAKMHWEMFSAECIRYYHSFFDTVLCMGLIYHMRDPVSLLHSIHNSLVKGGKIILESLGIISDESIALCPEGKYNGCSGIWFIPSLKCVGSWLKRADFKNIECFYSGRLSSEEQRSTKWADIKSFSDFIDPSHNITIEGYPLPHRFYLVATK